MTDRWWEPEGPDIGMGSVDVMLLLQGDDEGYDLGSALFALHKAGAAACEHAAQIPLVDANTLVESLATSRGNYAGPVVASISKSVGSPVYAGLLVRDVADAADRGAVDLFRQAVAKGVAPPLAAQRVGMVYGVPSDRMGAYKALATTPAANPVALRDAAERALFAHIHDIVEAEMVEDPVAKSYLEDHNEKQDAKGRFTRVKDKVDTDLSAAAIDALLAPEDKPAERPTRTPARTAGRATSRVTSRSGPRVEPTQPAAEPVVEPARPSRRTHTRENTRIRQQMKRAYERTAGVVIPSLGDPPAPPLSPAPKNAVYRPLHLKDNEFLSVFQNAGGWTQLVNLASKAGGTFSMDENQVSDPIPGRNDVGSASTSQRAQQDLMESYVTGWPTGHQPEVLKVMHDAVAGEAHMDEWEQAAYETGNAEEALAHRILNERGLRPETAEYDEELAQVLPYIKVMPDRTGDYSYAIYAPEGAPRLVELRVLDTNAVEADVNTVSSLITVNPHQRYKLQGDAMPMWDDQAKAQVVVQFVQPLYSGDVDPFEEAIKADYLTEHHVGQDAKGRFSSKDIDDLLAEPEAPVVARAPARTASRPGARVTSRAAARISESALRLESARPTPERTHERVQARVHQRLQMSRTEYLRMVKDLSQQAPLDFGPGQFDVLSHGDLIELMDMTDHDGHHEGDEIINMPSIIALSRAGREYMHSLAGGDSKATTLAVADAHRDFALHALDYPTEEEDEAEHPRTHLNPETRDQAKKGPEHNRQMLEVLGKYMAAHPDINEFAIEVMDVGQEYNDLQIHGIVNPAPPVVLQNQVEDWTKPIVLQRKTMRAGGSNAQIFSTTPQNTYKGKTQVGTDKTLIQPFTFTRPGHTFFVMKNVEGHKPPEPS